MAGLYVNVELSVKEVKNGETFVTGFERSILIGGGSSKFSEISAFQEFCKKVDKIVKESMKKGKMISLSVYCSETLSYFYEARDILPTEEGFYLNCDSYPEKSVYYMKDIWKDVLENMYCC